MDFKDWKRNETWADNKIQDTQQPDKYETDSDNESDEEGDFEVVYGSVHDQFGKIRTRSWLVRLYPELMLYWWLYDLI